MVITEDTIVPGAVQTSITPRDPEEQKRGERRIPDRNAPFHEPGTPAIPGASEVPAVGGERKVLPLRDFPLPEDIEWALAGDAEGEPIIEEPITPEPEIDQLGPECDVTTPPTSWELPVIDPEGELSITPEPDRSPGSLPDGPPGFPTPDTPDPQPVDDRHY